MRHDPGLAASPRVRETIGLRMEWGRLVRHHRRDGQATPTDASRDRSEPRAIAHETPVVWAAPPKLPAGLIQSEPDYHHAQ
jgi:hypothetical protein